MGPISLLIKPASGGCNLRCRYCFYRDLTAKWEESGVAMSEETMEKMVDRVFEEDPMDVTLAFQGGEPTLRGLDFFRKLAARVADKNTRRVPVHYAIQTNGMLLDGEWAAFLAENHFLVGLSMDGTREIPDALRPKADGKGSFSDVMKSARLLEKNGVDFNILTVVTNRLARHPEKVYGELKKAGFRYLQFIPCLDPFGETPEESFAPSAERLGEFYVRLFSLWYRDFMHGEYISIRWFDNLIRMAMGEHPEMCGLMGFCPGQLVIEGDGSVYPCDFYVNERYRLGNLLKDRFSDMLSSPEMAGFTEPSFAHEKACETCDYRYFCRGGCRRDRESDMGGGIGMNRFCTGYKAFFAVFMDKLPSVMEKLRTDGL